MSPYSMYLTGAFVTFALYRPSSAQLSGCDAVNCPLDEYHNPSCTIGNNTAAAIGISNFTVPLSDQPLTWTLAPQSLRNASSTSERDFFLGTPADLDLKSRSSNDSQLCAIFFNGAINRASFPGQDAENAQGTCDDALTAACANDIRNQAQAFRAQNRTITGNATAFCIELGEALQREAPPSCTVASDGQWAGVQPRTLTGSDVPDTLPRGNCTPTTGQDYALRQVESARVDAPSRDYTYLKPIIYGVTPILTATWDPNNGTVVTSDLSCLKTVGMQQNSTATPNQQSGGSGRLGMGWTSGVGLVATALLSAGMCML